MCFARRLESGKRRYEEKALLNIWRGRNGDIQSWRSKVRSRFELPISSCEMQTRRDACQGEMSFHRAGSKVLARERLARGRSILFGEGYINLSQVFCTLSGSLETGNSIYEFFDRSNVRRVAVEYSRVTGCDQCGQCLYRLYPQEPHVSLSDYLPISHHSSFSIASLIERAS